jgi:hypothetical protein
MKAARKFEQEGVIVEEGHPDLHEALNCAPGLRALSRAVGMRTFSKTIAPSSSPKSSGTSRKAWRSQGQKFHVPKPNAAPCSSAL